MANDDDRVTSSNELLSFDTPTLTAFIDKSMELMTEIVSHWQELIAAELKKRELSGAHLQFLARLSSESKVSSFITLIKEYAETHLHIKIDIFNFEF